MRKILRQCFSQTLHTRPFTNQCLSIANSSSSTRIGFKWNTKIFTRTFIWCVCFRNQDDPTRSKMILSTQKRPFLRLFILAGYNTAILTPTFLVGGEPSSVVIDGSVVESCVQTGKKISKREDAICITFRIFFVGSTLLFSGL